MKPNGIVRAQLFEVIENQIMDNNPPETKITYDRLRKQGYDDFATKQLIGQCLAIEIFMAAKKRQPYNNDRYVKNLKALPKEPRE